MPARGIEITIDRGRRSKRSAAERERIVLTPLLLAREATPRPTEPCQWL
jgi:hypothetical protein